MRFIFVKVISWLRAAWLIPTQPRRISYGERRSKPTARHTSVGLFLPAPYEILLITKRRQRSAISGSLVRSWVLGLFYLSH